MPFRVIKHGTRKLFRSKGKGTHKHIINKNKNKHLNTRRRHYSHRGGTTRSRSPSPAHSPAHSPARSASPARARSRSRSRSRSPARSRSHSPHSPQYPEIGCKMVAPDEVGLFKDDRNYAYTIDGRGDGKIGLVGLHTACIIGNLSDDYARDDDFVETLENGNYVFDKMHWVFDAADLKSSKKQRNLHKAWKKQVIKYNKLKQARDQARV